MNEHRQADLYLYDRAEAELRMAAKALVPEAAQVHQRLAALYLDRFYNRGAAPDRDPR